MVNRGAEIPPHQTITLGAHYEASTQLARLGQLPWLSDCLDKVALTAHSIVIAVEAARAGAEVVIRDLAASPHSNIRGRARDMLQLANHHQRTSSDPRPIPRIAGASSPWPPCSTLATRSASTSSGFATWPWRFGQPARTRGRRSVVCLPKPGLGSGSLLFGAATSTAAIALR